MRAHVSSLLMGAAALAAATANFSGKWVIEMPGRGGRVGATTILVLNHVGKEVTGTITARSDIGSGSPANTEVLGGVVAGDTITFYVWSGTDQPVKTIYEGRISGDDRIEMTVNGGPAAGGNPAMGRGPSGPQKVTARRAK